MLQRSVATVYYYCCFILLHFTRLAITSVVLSRSIGCYSKVTGVFAVVVLADDELAHIGGYDNFLVLIIILNLGLSIFNKPNNIN